MSSAPRTGGPSTRKASEDIAEHLRSLIATGALQPGELLPSEGALLETYGVARPTMRGALRILESDGLISIERGQHGGARIVEPDLRPLARRVGLHLQRSGVDLRELIEAQAIIQPGAVAQAARARDDADIERLRRVVDDCNTARTNHDLIAAVEAFGEALLQASHNRVLSLYAELTAVLLREKLGEYVTESGMTKKQIAAVIRWSTAQYAELVDLIEAGEAERAEQFWQAYLRRAGATPSTEPSPFELYRPER